MIPKEKAEELILKYKYHLDIELNNSGNIELAKLYSLIAVDEMINEYFDKFLFSKCDYWQEVKHELNNM